ncbi:MAG: hypothetical protein BWK80_47725 [Desulfobacteraceae bacterium IS3]|nr:MAG: hypothetical protein BWK80_47725 [Desulfobacteraceae bacterium IS3]
MGKDKTVILVRTRQDEQTVFSYDWAEAIKQAFLEQGWMVQDCSEAKALRAKVEKSLTESGTVFMFYGHGLPDRLIGQNNQPVCDLSNSSLFKDYAVYVMACHSAKILGPAMIKDGASCYFGYADEIMIDFQHSDDIGICINSGLLEWIKNPQFSAVQIRHIIFAKYNQWIDFHSDIGGQHALFAADLRHNRDALKLLGNTQTSLI